MAPELLPPARPRYGIAGDIWACGIIAYVLLAGHVMYAFFLLPSSLLSPIFFTLFLTLASFVF